MKRNAIIRILGIAIILSLLLMVVPVLPAYAADSMSISPTSGMVGGNITVYCSFTPLAQERYANVFLSPNNITPITGLLTSMTTYKRVGGAEIPVTGETSAGNFTITFPIPVSLLDGSITQNVTSGTYYVYTSVDTSGLAGTNIRTAATLTVTAPTLDPLSPDSGPAGTSVLVTGANFPASTALVFKFDTTTITPTSGHTSTLSTGLFLSYITIPSTATVGTHTVNVTAGTVTTSRNFVVTASATIALSVAQGAAGSTVTVTGTGFPASTALVFKFDINTTNTALIPTGDSTTSASGTFYSIITIPLTATIGTHTITATAAAGTDSENFIVTSTPTTTPPTTTPPTTTPPTTTPPTTTPPTTTPPTPTATVPISFSQSGDTVGSSISVGGGGFTPNSTVTVRFDDKIVATATADASGFFVAPPFAVPSSQHGVHTIVATDGTHIGSKIYTLESTAPGTPLPLSPAMGEAISSPASFDWSDVDDASKPVTYNLQIATTNTFNADSILINTTNITGSQYTLTEAEQLKLASEITYYWRECAVDAAFNASSWTGAGEFTMIKPFEFIGWPLYLTIGLGGLVLFLLGLWVGRRTAFYY